MAQRRMFSKTIIESDAFCSLSKDAQILYLHLGMAADDDGFLNNSKGITRGLGLKPSALEELIEKRFLLAFPSGNVVIKHWKINNYIPKDRYKPTICEEIELLTVKENGSYTECIQDVYSLDTQVRLGKDRLGKDKKDKDKKGRFAPPSIEELTEYISSNGYHVNPETFFSYYTSNGWKVGKNPMKDWKAAVRTWETKEKNNPKKPLTSFHNFPSAHDDQYAELIKQIEGGA